MASSGEPRRPGRWGSLLARWPALLLGAGLLVWFGPWLVAAEPRMGGDVTIEHYPRWAYAVEQVRGGALPLWAPFTMAGVPFLANPQVALFYPPNWVLLALLPPGMAINYAAALHVALALAGAYVLARRWSLGPAGAAFAATSYGFNGLFAARLWAGNTGIAAAASWLPAVLLAGDYLRAQPGWRATAAMSGVLTLSLLVGSYQPWFLGVLVVAAFLAVMPGAPGLRLRRLGGLLVAGAVSLGLAAVQLVPAAEVVRLSLRAGRLDWHFATDASLPPWHLPTLLLPDLFGSGAGTYWPGPWWHWHELTYYAGLLPLVLVPLALRRPREAWVRYCTVVAAVALVLALGRYTPVYGWFYDWVPGYGSFRDPPRHLLVASLAVALLAGRGAERLLSGRGYRATTLALLGLVLAGALGAVGALQAADSAGALVVQYLQEHGLWHARPDTTTLAADELGATVLLLAARACGLAVVAAAVALVAVVLARRGPPARQGALLVVALFVDLSLFGWRHLHTPLPLAPGVAFGPPEAQFVALLGSDNVARLQRARGSERAAVLGQEGAVAANAGYLLGMPLANGLDPLLPRRYAEVAALVNGAPVAAFDNLVLYLEDRPSPLWPLLNAPHRLVPQARDDGPGVRFVLRLAAAPLSTVFALTEVRAVGGPAESLAALATLDPTRTVIVEASAGLPPPFGPAEQDVAPARGTIPVVRENRPGDVRVTADLPGPGAVVLLQTWHPGWRATIDGQPTAVYPADHAFVAVLAPAGVHEVHFHFEPASWVLGLFVSTTTAALLLGAAGLLVLRRGRAARAGRAE